MKRKVTKQAIEALHAQLCKVYKLPLIPIVWTSTRRGRFVYKPTTIRLGINCWRGIKTSYIHEFAHYVDYSTHGPYLHHGKEFYDSLLKVAEHVLGNPKKYKWSTEYKSVLSRWREDTLDRD